MAISIGEVEATLRLRDEMSGQIGTVLGRVAEMASAFGLAEVALDALREGLHLGAEALKELTVGGAQVADVEDAFDRLTTGAGRLGETLLSTLRAGTHGTISDFELMKMANQSLAAGLELTDAQLKTMADGAFALAQAKAISVKEAMDLMNDAMLTGRVRSVALLTGKIDLADAEQKYADKIKISRDYLTADEKTLAVREELLTRVAAATQRLGAQTDGLDEKVDQVRVTWANFTEDLGKAVARSPAIAAGFDGIARALAGAFSSDRDEAIKDVAGAIDQVAIHTVDLGLAVVETARVIHTAWSGIAVVVLGVETAIVGVVTGVAEAYLGAEKLAAALGLSSEENVAKIQETVTHLEGMTKGLAADTAEAARGVVGLSAFDQMLDRVGGSLFVIRDRMDAAAAATAGQTKATNEAAEATAVHERNVALLAKTQEQLSATTVKRQQYEDDMWKIEKQSLVETTQLWDEYFSLRVAHSGTTDAAQRANIQKWFDDEVAKLDYSDRNWQQHYAALEAVAKEKLGAVGSHWEELAAQSRESLQRTADAAFEDYDRMVESGLTFTRDVLDAQLEKARQLQQAANAMGGAYVDAYAKSKAAADELAAKQIKELERLQALKEANRALGGSMSVTAENLSERLSQAGLGGTELSAAGLAKEGYSFEEIVDFLLHSGGRPTHKPIGPRIPGYAMGIEDAPGGRAVVGEHGPEVISLPPHASVTPTEKLFGPSVTNHIYVNGTAADVARKVADEIMRTLKQNHRFGSA